MTHNYTRRFKAGNTIRLLSNDRLEELKEWIFSKNLTKNHVKLIRREISGMDFLLLIAIKDLEIEWLYKKPTS